MSFTNTEPQKHNSENTWFTPKKYIDELGLVEKFDLDPCTVSYRPFNTALKHIEHDKGECGLKTEWYGDVWLNPPYGKEIAPFVDKFINHRKGLMLIFARMGSVSIQQLLKHGAYIYCLRRRLYFIHKDGVKKTNAGTDSCLVFFDNKYINRVNFFEGVLIKLHTGDLK